MIKLVLLNKCNFEKQCMPKESSLCMEIFLADNFGAKNSFVLFYRNIPCRLKIKTKFVNVLVTAKFI